MRPLDNSPEYYCYILHNPLTKEPFYVGKGKGKRMYRHEKDARSGRVISRNGFLYKEIKSIIQSNQSPICETVQDKLTELEAFALEAATIEYYGIDNLCNIRMNQMESHQRYKPAVTAQKIKQANRHMGPVNKMREAAAKKCNLPFQPFQSYIELFNYHWKNADNKEKNRQRIAKDVWLKPELKLLKEVISDIRKTLQEQKNANRVKESDADLLIVDREKGIRLCPQCNATVQHNGPTKVHACLQSAREKNVCITCRNASIGTKLKEYYKSHTMPWEGRQRLASRWTVEQSQREYDERPERMQRAIDGLRKKLESDPTNLHLQRTLKGMMKSQYV